ncbi:MAG: cadherin-like beta sandwich domain-containing protein [Lachnospiraceae bacterium]|nr:cadherin-like beta sandwich domain-containing protein [Lachnospiraceae bacterium]
MKQLKRSIQIIMLSLIVVVSCKMNVFAAGNSISFSDPTAKKGETVIVTVKVASDSTDLGAVDMTLVYDSDALEFTGSGSAVKGGSGSIRIADTASDSSTKTLSYELTFTALKAGSASLKVSNYEVFGFDESVISMDHVGSSSITVTDESKTLSKDASLKELKLSNGTLSPAFSPSTMNYTASVGADISSIVVSGTTSHENAAITSINGADNLKEGQNTVKVSVTAESGATAVYTIIVTKGTAAVATETPLPTAEATAAPEPTGETQTQGSGTIVVNDKQLTPLALPADAELKGYTKGTLEYNGETMEALVSDYMDLYVIYMTDTNDNKDYYVYYKDVDQFTEFIKIENSGDKFIVVLDGYPRDISIYGFERTTIMINDKKANVVWKYTDELISYSSAAAEYYLVGGLSESGVNTWYVYDFVDKTYQRYFVQPANLIEEETGPDLTLTEQEQQVKELNEALQKSKNSRLMVIGVLAFIVLILIMVSVNLFLKVRSLKDEIEELEEGDTDTDTDEQPVPVKKRKEVEPEDDFFDEADGIPKEMEDEIIKAKIIGKEAEEDEFEESLKLRKSKPKQKKPAKVEEKEFNEDDFDFEFIDLDDK